MSVTAAVAVCRGCLVRAWCLLSALDNEERFGIWGGTTPAQRRVLTIAYDMAVRG